jgi:hypothetical protein
MSVDRIGKVIGNVSNEEIAKVIDGLNEIIA